MRLRDRLAALSPSVAARIGGSVGTAVGVDVAGIEPGGVPADEVVLRARVAENEGRKSVITGTIVVADDPGRVLVEARGVFVLPRPEKVEAYFGSITDAAGRHTPPSRPTDATALDED